MLQIDPMHLNHLPFFLEVRNECADCLHDNKRFQLFEALQWWKNNWGSDCYANMGDKKYKIITINKEPVGYIRTSIVGLPKGNISVGVDIHKNHRKKGYAWKTYEYLFQEYFHKYSWSATPVYHRIELEVLANNEPAITLYQKLGFKQEGIKRQVIYRNGEYIDSIIMSVLQSEWEELPYLNNG
jgi:RimJ/RimL family protein N-acetyltransferase